MCRSGKRRERLGNLGDDAPVMPQRPQEPGDRLSGRVPGDEPEHGRPPIVVEDDGGRELGPKNDADTAVDEASEESFPASDPPSWSSAERVRGT